MWPLDESSKQLAFWITSVFGGLALAWKIFLRVRRDGREDRAGSATSEGYELIIAGQRAEITRLHESLDDLAKRMSAEISVRREMETEAAALRRRADHAEARAEQAFARARAGEEAALIFKAQISALEMEVERLEKAQTGPGDLP